MTHREFHQFDPMATPGDPNHLWRMYQWEALDAVEKSPGTVVLLSPREGSGTSKVVLGSVALILLLGILALTLWGFKK